MIENIQAFLDDRKELWLKERLKKVKDDHEIIALQQQATAKFSLAEWLSDAANRAKQLTIVSHPAKFSHPRAQVSDIYFISDRKNDGYIKSGNVNYPFDI
ncbi:type I-F CRISPR-associated protein Csy1, partial [Acinetobacter ursingii]